MYRFVFCTTLNPLGETRCEEYDSLHDIICCLINFRNKQCELFSAGYSVYSVNSDGSNGKTLLNWQHNGKNTFGRLIDPNKPQWFFEA